MLLRGELTAQGKPDMLNISITVTSPHKDGQPQETTLYLACVETGTPYLQLAFRYEFTNGEMDPFTNFGSNSIFGQFAELIQEQGWNTSFSDHVSNIFIGKKNGESFISCGFFPLYHRGGRPMAITKRTTDSRETPWRLQEILDDATPMLNDKANALINGSAMRRIQRKLEALAA